MRIEHIALWAKDLEVMKEFYVRYFRGCSGEKYINPEKGFSSYFIRFEEGARLEIMHNAKGNERAGEPLGYSHIAFEFNTERVVDTLTEALRNSGFTVVSGPRTTGDGYYESCVLDPEGNKVELTSGKV